MRKSRSVTSEKQLSDANDAKEKELLFTIAKVLRFEKIRRVQIVDHSKNVGNDPELTAKIYDICDPLSDTDARSIRERIREQ